MGAPCVHGQDVQAITGSERGVDLECRAVAAPSGISSHVRPSSNRPAFFLFLPPRSMPNADRLDLHGVPCTQPAMTRPPDSAHPVWRRCARSCTAGALSIDLSGACTRAPAILRQRQPAGARRATSAFRAWLVRRSGDPLNARQVTFFGTGQPILVTGQRVLVTGQRVLVTGSVFLAQDRSSTGQEVALAAVKRPFNA